MHQPKRNSFPSADSLANCTHQGLHAQGMLCLIVIFLAMTLQHLSLKVNLSGIRTQIHMNQWCSDLLVDCLCLQRDIHGIKCCQGTPSSMQLLIRDEMSCC